MSAESVKVLNNIGRSNEILDREGVGNRQLFCFFKVKIDSCNYSMLTANLKFINKKSSCFFLTPTQPRFSFEA
jgi:hypothetical protein